MNANMFDCLGISPLKSLTLILERLFDSLNRFSVTAILLGAPRHFKMENWVIFGRYVDQ